VVADGVQPRRNVAEGQPCLQPVVGRPERAQHGGVQLRALGGGEPEQLDRKPWDSAARRTA